MLTDERYALLVFGVLNAMWYEFGEKK